METVRKQLTNEERQANIDRLIARWKASREESRRETEEFAKTPRFKEILEELKEKNAKRGIIIPGI
jgi:phosphopentomutase